MNSRRVPVLFCCGGAGICRSARGVLAKPAAEDASALAAADAQILSEVRTTAR